jgi:hypothetical protein
MYGLRNLFSFAHGEQPQIIGEWRELPGVMAFYCWRAAPAVTDPLLRVVNDIKRTCAMLETCQMHIGDEAEAQQRAMASRYRVGQM